MTLHAGRILHADLGTIRALLPEATIGSLAEIQRPNAAPLLAEVIAVTEHEATLAPWGETTGIRANMTVTLRTRSAPQLCDEKSRGRVTTPIGEDIFTGESLCTTHREIEPPRLRDRVAQREHLTTGLRAVDTLIPLVKGQRVGIFAGAGVGKTTLLTQLAQQVPADRIVVCLVGERSREAVSLIEVLRGLPSWPQTTTIIATADMAAALRVRAAWLATELAMQSRQRGEHCLLLFDSLTRWTRARRDLALMAGERPGRGGFPPSAFAALAPLLELAGATRHGAITALYTVLLEGDDMDDPIGDEVRGLVEGHWILNRKIAERQIFPAIDLRASLSRLATECLPPESLQHYQYLRAAYAQLENLQEAESFGLYSEGTNAALDTIAAHRTLLTHFQRQKPDENITWNEARTHADALCQQLHQGGFTP